MGNKLKNKSFSARRAATFLAALGVLVLSSGVALMVTATPANAADKVTFCHSTGSASNPWVEETTAVAAFYQGHVLAQHTSDIYPAVHISVGKKDIDVAAQGDQAVLGNHCNAVVPENPPTHTTASVVFTDPTCTVAASYATSGANVAFDHPVAAPGATITVHASPVGNVVIDGPAEFTHTFAAAPTNCGSTVSTPQTPPSVSPPKVKHHTTTKATVTPTVVHAGLASTTVQDMRGEQGLALMVAGMVMLVGAGGLRVRASNRSRI